MGFAHDLLVPRNATGHSIMSSAVTPSTIEFLFFLILASPNDLDETLYVWLGVGSSDWTDLTSIVSEALLSGDGNLFAWLQLVSSTKTKRNTTVTISR